AQLTRPKIANARRRLRALYGWPIVPRRPRGCGLTCGWYPLLRPATRRWAVRPVRGSEPPAPDTAAPHAGGARPTPAAAIRRLPARRPGPRPARTPGATPAAPPTAARTAARPRRRRRPPRAAA